MQAARVVTNINIANQYLQSGLFHCITQHFKFSKTSM